MYGRIAPIVRKALGEHLPPLFFPTTYSIVALAAVPVMNNLPMCAGEHFCQEAKREAGTSQETEAGVR